jgi:hypothetical protein
VTGSSLSHTHHFMGFSLNRNSLPTVSPTPTIYGVSDTTLTFTPTPTPRSCSSLSPTHRIHIPTPPTSTFLTFTCTQVLWFLSRLTRPCASDGPLDPVLVLLLFLSTQSSVCESFRSLRFSVESLIIPTPIYPVFSLTLTLPLIINKPQNAVL